MNDEQYNALEQVVIPGAGITWTRRGDWWAETNARGGRESTIDNQTFRDYLRILIKRSDGTELKDNILELRGYQRTPESKPPAPQTPEQGSPWEKYVRK